MMPRHLVFPKADSLQAFHDDLGIRRLSQRQDDSTLIVPGYSFYDMTRMRGGDFCLFKLYS